MAQYTMQEADDLNNEGRTLLFPKMIIRDCCGGDELARLVAEGTTFSAGEVGGMLRLLCREMAAQMAAGRSVRVEGVGLFTPSLSLRRGREREGADGTSGRRNAASIEVGGVRFRPDRSLLAELNARCRLERSPVKYVRHVSPFSGQERLERARDFLARHPVMTVADYVRLSGLGRTAAGQELRRWVSDPSSGIGATGRGSHRVFVARAVPPAPEVPGGAGE